MFGLFTIFSFISKTNKFSSLYLGNEQILSIVTFLIKFNKVFFKKLLVVHHKEKKKFRKKLRIVELFYWIVFLIIMTPLDLSKKVKDYGYLIIFQTLKNKLVGFKDKRENCKLPKHK